MKNCKNLAKKTGKKSGILLEDWNGFVKVLEVETKQVFGIKQGFKNMSYV